MVGFISIPGFLGFFPSAAHAQTHEHDTSSASVAAGVQGVLLGTHVTPAMAGESRTEGYLTQPALMVHAAALGFLDFSGTFVLEGLTLERGELDHGIWGEGYVDRRHPHTYLHEAMLTARVEQPVMRGSVSAGKGFVPFGTDDPMSRPFVKYPANHHLAQILERYVLIGGVGARYALFEGALFNGDEPLNASDMPSLDRFADSWSLRASVFPATGVEVQGSFAQVESPEQPFGGGYDQQKWSLSGRVEVERAAGRWYALAEWARTEDFDDDVSAGARSSFLAEAAFSRGPMMVALRGERTLRPEEERTGNPFRTPWPHSDVHTLGATRWHIVTAHAERALTPWGVRLAPFLELAFHHASDTEPLSAFKAERVYGSASIWSFSAGVRMRAGMVHGRMGRYGIARTES